MFDPRALPLSTRRLLVATLVSMTVIGVTFWLAVVLGANGLSVLDVLMLALFAATATIVALSFWSALIGAVLLRLGLNPVASCLPPGTQLRDPIESRVAVLMPVCDEVPDEVFRHLRFVAEDLDREPSGRCFDYFVLSDSREPGTREREQALFQDWQRHDPMPERLHYRWRARNDGFKAGNIWDFCARRGDAFDLMVVLDADSVMTGAAVRRLVRMIEAAPAVGILQPLIVGLPASSPFARLFQFGMRHGMRAYGTGTAWWQGDEGCFWGHNAVIRIRPFLEHCRLPVLPGNGPLGGHVMSHDQVEAVLMRKGGPEVRVVPLADGSLEQTPPTLPDFVRRDLRWCQGNMQYLKLLNLPGLRLLGRVQLLLAIMLFAASPLWLGFLALGLTQAVSGGSAELLASVDLRLGLGLFAVMMTMVFAPKLIGVGEALLSTERAAAFGGRVRLLAGAGLETVFSILLGPVMAIAHTIFMGGLLFGRRIRWQGQSRSDRRIGWTMALVGLWPQTLTGIAVTVLLALAAPGLLPWAAPVLIGLLLAVPFAVVTSSPSFGRFLTRHGLAATPEELAASGPALPEAYVRRSRRRAKLQPGVDPLAP